MVDSTRTARAHRRRPVHGLARRIARTAAQRYVAGAEVADAMAVAERTVADGGRATIAAWTAPTASAEQATEAHLAAIHAVAAAPFDATVAVKPGAMDHRPPLVDAVVAAAREHGIEVFFDAHGTDDAPPTLAAASRSSASGHPAVGVALPSRWARSLDDARRAREQGWAVRLIKGQWPDSGPAEIDPSDGLLRIAEQLRGHPRTVRIATHDAPLLAAVADRLDGTSTRLEVELLLGLPLAPATATARKLGLPVRLYVAFGVADIPYPLRAARRDPALALRLVRDATVGHRRRR